MVGGWDADDHSQPKVFTLAGFNTVPAEKADLVAKIISLGGTVIDGSCWNKECTHVIAANFGQYLEKVMAGLVSGRWVVTKRFVERSYQKGGWANTKAFVSDELVLTHRKWWFEHGGMFKDLKTVLLLENTLKRGVYTRIVEAGGGQVYKNWDLGDLLNNQPCSDDLSCVVVDPSIQLVSDKRHEQWRKWMEVAKDTWPRNSSLPHVYYKYIFSIITTCKRLPAENFSIFSPAVMEMASRDGNMPLGWSSLKRPSVEVVSPASNKRMKVNGTETKIVTTVIESNVVTLGDSDSDDDIEILEQKINQRKTGSRRTYYEKPKSSRRPISVTGNAEVVDLSDSDEESKSKNAITSKEVLEVSMELDQDARGDNSDEESVQETPVSVKVLEIETDESSRKSSESETCAVPESRDSGGISLGLQHAISALQQTSRGPVRLTKSKSKSKKEGAKNNSAGSTIDVTPVNSNEDNSTDDDIEIISSKAGVKVKKHRRVVSKLDTRAKMFQSRLKDLLEAENSNQSSELNQTSVEIPLPVRSPSPEIPKITEPEEVPLPSTPVEPFVTQTSDKSTILLHKVLSCILERQTFTDECIAVSNTNCRTARFDKHKESGGLAESKVKPVDSTVKEEFYQKYLEKSVQKEAESSEIALSGQLNQISNCISSLRYLSCSTSFTCHPTPAILNSLFVDYILEQSSPMVRVSAYSYLDQFLFLHLGRESGTQVQDRSAWLHLMLSACRSGRNIQWDNFSVENKQDIAQCWKFFTGAVQQYQATCKENSGDGQTGPELLLQLLMKLMQKDFELWWKHFRRSDSKEDRELCYPLLYYLLDGSTSLVLNMKTCVVRLYSSLLASDSDLSLVRRLVSMCAMLLAHMDCHLRQSFIFSGTKLEFASSIQAVFTQCSSTRQEYTWLFTELSLLQPPWLAFLVARHFILKQSGQDQTKVNTVSDLTTKMSQLKVSSSPLLRAATECLAHRVVSSCHLHTVLRTHWEHNCGMQNQGSSWKMMDRMDKVGLRSQPNNKAVRFRNGVSFKTSNIVDDLNIVAQYVNGEKIAENESERGAVGSLLFKMTSPINF